MKLKNHKEISYTDIAYKAVDLGKKPLGKKLLDLEPNIKKKIPVLLFMEEYSKAL